MRIGLLGGLRVEHDGREVSVSGAMQLAVLFRLAVDAGSAVSYRAIAEDIWGMDAPENTRASLQSIVSRLRSQLPAGVIESTSGGYRLGVGRSDVDALAFTDLVAAASTTTDEAEARRLASEALLVWSGEPWIPSENFDWFERDLRKDRAQAVGLGGVSPVAPVTSRNTVPTPLTALIGRGAELAMIADQLAASRLVTIVGTGGAGKTRLALEAASRQRFALLVELAPVGPHEVMAAIQTAIGRDMRSVDTSEPTGTRERVLESLHARDVLLVLDNCEHVIDEAARVAEDLLQSLPQLRILATSREPLAIPGEAFVAVGSLAHPREADLGDPGKLLSFPALELFQQRAAAARGVDLDESELLIAARITARLDGLPLALELAAAKLRTMTVQEVLDGLEHRFTLLTGGYRTALPRHQTLSAMIDWSWSLLSDEERRALASLAVFPSGVDSGDAAGLAVLMEISSASIFDSLVDKSLLQRSRGRYRTLETIREYGIEKLAETGRIADARELQACHAASRAQEVDRLLRGPRINEAIAWFDAEEDNISAALRFAVSVPLAEVAVTLATSCAWYWTIRDRGDDARIWFAEVGPLAEAVETDEARLIALAGTVMHAFGGTAGEELNMENPLEGPLAMLMPVADMKVDVNSHELFQLFPVAVRAFGKVVGESEWMLKVRLPLGEDLGLAPWPTAVLHVMRAAMAQNRGDVTELGLESELAVAQFTEVGDLWGLALAQEMRAHWLTLLGHLDDALALSDESTENMRRITSSLDLAQQQGLAISILARQGRFDEAYVRVEKMLQDADVAASSRTQLQAQINAVMIDLLAGNMVEASTRLVTIDELALGWPGLPPQLSAFIESAKATVALLRDDDEAAEQHLRSAADAAFRSHDQPVIGMVAVALGTLALHRGDIRKALDAVELADALVGAHDATDPRIRAIMEAAAKAGIGRDDAEAPSRPVALEALQRLVGA